MDIWTKSTAWLMTLTAVVSCSPDANSGPPPEETAIRRVLTEMLRLAEAGDWASLEAYFLPDSKAAGQAYLAVTRPGMYEAPSFWLPGIETVPDTWRFDIIAPERVVATMSYEMSIYGAGRFEWKATFVQSGPSWIIACDGYYIDRTTGDCSAG